MTVAPTSCLKSHPATKQEVQPSTVEQSAEATLPNWKLQANWLMRKIAYAWYGLEPVQNYVDEPNFLSYFTDIIIQYLVDIDENKERTYDMARNVLYHCTVHHKQVFYVRHSANPSFTLPADEAEWIMEAVCLYVKRFDLMSEEMIWIINTARILQSLLKTYNRRPVDGLMTVLPLSYYEDLPNSPMLPF